MIAGAARGPAGHGGPRGARPRRAADRDRRRRADLDETGFIGQVYEDAAAGPKAGFYLETLGAILLLASGGLMLALPAAGAPAPRVRRRERERPADAED